MKCQIDRGQLSAYLDGELSPGEQERVRMHLDQCAGCRQEYQQLVQLTQAVGNLRRQAPMNLWAGVERRLAEPTPRRRSLARAWTQFSWRPLAAAAILAIGMLMYFWLNQPAEELPLEYYLEAHADFTAATPFTTDAMVAFVLPEERSSADSNVWEGDMDLMLETYLEAY